MDESKKQAFMAFLRLACALVAAGLAMFGVAVDSDALFVGVMTAVALVAYIWSWWKLVEEQQRYRCCNRGSEGSRRA